MYNIVTWQSDYRGGFGLVTRFIGLSDTTYDYTLVSTAMSSLPLLGSCFQQRNGTKYLNQSSPTLHCLLIWTVAIHSQICSTSDYLLIKIWLHWMKYLNSTYVSVSQTVSSGRLTCQHISIQRNWATFQAKRQLFTTNYFIHPSELTLCYHYVTETVHKKWNTRLYREIP
jgi:hypothetical protein